MSMDFWTIIFVCVVFLQIAICSHFSCGPCRCWDRHTADCSNRHLSAVPTKGIPKGIKTLDLSTNHISSFSGSLAHYKNLTYINASFNTLVKLDINDFANVSELEVLDLCNNMLSLTYSTYPVGVFRNQANLKVFKVSNNSPVTKEYHYPLSSFLDIRFLEVLAIDGLEMFEQLSFVFKNLTNLTLTGNCYIRELTNGSFIFMPNLRYLEITNCQLLSIEASTFEPLRNLLVLDISHNPYLGIPNVGKALYGLQNSSLIILKANYIRLWTGLGSMLKREDLKYISSISTLEEIHLDYNHIELCEFSAPCLLPSSVKKISVRNNAFSFGIYLLTAGACLKNVEYVDASGNDGSHGNPFAVAEMLKQLKRPLKNRYRSQRNDNGLQTLAEVAEENIRSSDVKQAISYLQGPWPGEIIIPIPENAQFGNFSGSKLNFYIFELRFKNNTLKKLDLSFNFFTRWLGPVKGLDQLEYLDVSHNYCDTISDFITENLPSLKILNISSNYLGYTLTNNTFKNLTSVHEIDLSNNKIDYIPKMIFRNTFEVRILKLNNNSLRTWESSLAQMKHLEYLDLSHNDFEKIPKFLKHEIEIHPNKHLKIGFINPLLCACQTLHSLKWMEARYSTFFSFENIRCKSGTGLSDIIKELDQTCASYVGILLVTAGIVLVALMLSAIGILYRYRWKLRYLYYLARNNYRRRISETDEEEFEYDAFVSYADGDRGIVVGKMRHRLENTYGLKLCIHHRDFLPGEAIAANILNAVRSSRKLVVMLSREFVKSSWCRYEVEMAKMESIHSGRDMLLIVILEEIPAKDIPADILEVMIKDTYLKYPGDQQTEEHFWQNLNRAIRVQ